MKSIYRPRSVYLSTTILIMAAGLASRKYSMMLPNLVNEYLGDMLWAMMIYSLFSLTFNRFSIFKITSLSLVFCYAIELSQLYHRPWIDAIRHTTLGGLVLGFGFLWSDILSYSLGIFICFFAEYRFYKYSQ